ncbi:MAG: hypothetical protein WBC04_07280 [Candidatus Acidiferrales bacterium]
MLARLIPHSLSAVATEAGAVFTVVEAAAFTEVVEVVSVEAAASTAAVVAGTMLTAVAFAAGRPHHVWEAARTGDLADMRLVPTAVLPTEEDPGPARTAREVSAEAGRARFPHRAGALGHRRWLAISVTLPLPKLMVSGIRLPHERVALGPQWLVVSAIPCPRGPRPRAQEMLLERTLVPLS